MQTQKNANLAYKFKELEEDLFEELSDEKSSRVCGGFVSRPGRKIAKSTEDLLRRTSSIFSVLEEKET